MIRIFNFGSTFCYNNKKVYWELELPAYSNLLYFANSAPKTVVSIPLLVTQNKDMYMIEFRIVAEQGERWTLRGSGMIDNLTMVGTRDTHYYKIITDWQSKMKVSVSCAPFADLSSLYAFYRFRCSFHLFQSWPPFQCRSSRGTFYIKS